MVKLNARISVGYVQCFEQKSYIMTFSAYKCFIGVLFRFFTILNFLKKKKKKNNIFLADRLEL